MPADVEDEIAGADELGIQASKTELSQRDRVIDHERTCETNGAVEATHVRRVRKAWRPL
jgi:hypothetical protein